MSADGDGFKHFRQPEAEWYPAGGSRGHCAVLRRFFSLGGRRCPAPTRPAAPPDPRSRHKPGGFVTPDKNSFPYLDFMDCFAKGSVLQWA